MKNKSCDTLNESNLILPFHYNGRMKKFEEYIKAKDYKKDKDKDQTGYTWLKDSRRTYRYLAAHIDALIDNENKDSICYSYHLSSLYRTEQQWPSSRDKVSMESRIIKGGEKPEAFSFLIDDITMFFFKTGLGFLIINIKHEVQEPLSSIEDKSFSLTRFYTKEIEGAAKSSEVLFTYRPMELKEEDAGIDFSLSQMVNQILQVTKSEEDKIKLFPSSNKKECNIFHRIIVDKPLEREELDSNLYILRRAFHSSFYQNREDACDNQSTDFIYQTQHNNYFSFCQRGLVCLYYPTENRDVFIKHFTNNVRFDYFFIYLFLLHERQALFYYNSVLLHARKKTIGMKKLLIDFRFNYSFKVISDEASYQNFYTILHKALSLDELNADIQDIIDRASDHQKNTHENSTNTALAVLALFGILSAFESGFAIIDRIESETPLTRTHGITSMVIGGMVLIAIGVFIYLKKRK